LLVMFSLTFFQIARRAGISATAAIGLKLWEERRQCKHCNPPW
jgi:hypothetical protein